MTMKLIKTEADHQAALQRLDELFDLDPAVGSKESDEIDVLALLIETYEKDAFPIDLPDPIEAIKFRMDQQGLVQKDVIPFFGSKSKVSEVLNGKRALSLNMIRKLNEGLDIPYEVLMQEQAPTIESDEIEWSAFPISEMKKRGLFENVDSTYTNIKDYAEELVCQFFSKVPQSFELKPALLRSSAQSGGNSKTDDPYALWAWQVEAKHKALKIQAPSFKHDRITDDFLRSLAKLSNREDGPLSAIKKLNEIGIRVVIASKYLKTYIDGAAFLLAEDQPVIALTLRYNRLDNFWFTLMHEVAHVKLHLNSSNTWILDDLDAGSINAFEKEANELAQDSLIPQEFWTGIIGDEYDIEQVAKIAQVHKSIVAGRYAYQQNDHSRYSHLVQEPVRQFFS